MFKLTEQINPNPNSETRVREVKDMPDSHAEVLRTSLADMISETDDMMRSDITDAEFEAELKKANELEKAVYGLLENRNYCYGTVLTALLWMVADLQFEMADIVLDKEAADTVAERIDKHKKEKEA